jgi:cell division protein FtsA
MSNHIITALDIGSSSVKVLAVGPKQQSSKLEVLSQVSIPSFGVRRGVVVDVEKASEIVSSALEKVKTEIGQKIKSVFVNIDGSHIFSTFSHGTIAVSRADQKISKEDVERVLQAAQTFSLPQNREILEVFPKEFVVDGEKGIRQAEGLEGVRLEAEILVVGCFSPYLKNLQNAVLEADYQIADILCNPLPSARAVLSPKEKELGVLLLDIGAGTTSFAVFVEQSLLCLGVIPVGSGHVTNDIAIGLKTDVETAENIKLKYGACFLKGAKKLKVKEQSTGETLSFSKKALGKIIDSRVSEIFELIQKDLKKVSFPRLPGGVVLCGGGAKLPKIKEFAKKSFKLSCKIGKISSFFPKIDDPQMTTVCGLALYGAKDLEEETLSQGIVEKAKSIFKNFIP